MHKSQKTIIANVDRVAQELAYRLDNISWTRYFWQLVKLCEEEEKSHRGWNFARHHPHAPGVKATGRFFAVHRIGQYLTWSVRLPEARDYLRLQRSAFQAAAIVENYRAECIEALQRAEVSAEYLAGLDYVAFVSPEDVKEGGAA